MKHRQKENHKSLCQPEKTAWETYFLYFLFFNLEEFGSYGKTHEMYFFLPWSWFYTFIYLYSTSFHKLYFILFWFMHQSSMEQSGILRKSEIYLFQSLPCFLFLIPLSKLLCFKLTCQGVLWLGSNNSLTSVESPLFPTESSLTHCCAECKDGHYWPMGGQESSWDPKVGHGASWHGLLKLLQYECITVPGISVETTWSRHQALTSQSLRPSWGNIILIHDLIQTLLNAKRKVLVHRRTRIRTVGD